MNTELQRRSILEGLGLQVACLNRYLSRKHKTIVFNIAKPADAPTQIAKALEAKGTQFVLNTYNRPNEIQYVFSLPGLYTISFAVDGMYSWIEQPVFITPAKVES
jgi:hypothetical protein